MLLSTHALRLGSRPLAMRRLLQSNALAQQLRREQSRTRSRLPLRAEATAAALPRWFATLGDGARERKEQLLPPLPLSVETVDPTYPKPRTDINKVYFPTKGYRASSKDVVVRAMIGNSAITVLKTLAWLKTGSSAMLSEAIHSLVDTGNQGLLILGLRQAAGVPDKKHQYGYGRAAYFWSLISALGIFWLGAGVTITHGVQSLLHPPEELVLSWEVWTVLGASFMIDGWVLRRAVQELMSTKPPGMSLYQHFRRIKDPFMMAVLLEDMSACTGVLMAVAGIGATHVTGNPLWDSIASISIGALLGGVAVTLIRLNQRYLLGQSVEPEIEKGIRELLLSRPSIDNVYAVQSQWVGPSTFSYKVRAQSAVNLAASSVHLCRVLQHLISLHARVCLALSLSAGRGGL